MENESSMYSKEWRDYLDLAEERPELFKASSRLQIIMDYESVQQFERNTDKKIGVVYRSAYNLLVVDLVENMKGERFAYERLIPAVKKGAIVSIPVYDDKFVLLKQYRHAMRAFQYAFPRGFGEEGLSAEEISDIFEEDTEIIKKICIAIQTCEGQCTIDDVYEQLYK